MIVPATVRDATYVTANLNPEDDRETRCQFYNLNRTALGVLFTQQAYAYVADVKGVPAVVFGATPMGDTTVSAWTLGTRKAPRAMPAVTRFIEGPLARQLYADGYRWAEARSIVDHDVAHRWLESMGAKRTAELEGYGVGGEDFVLFRLPILPYDGPR